MKAKKRFTERIVERKIEAELWEKNIRDCMRIREENRLARVPKKNS